MKILRNILFLLLVLVLILIMYSSATNRFSVQQMFESKWKHTSEETRKKEKKETVKFPEYVKDKTGYLKFDAQVESHGVTKVASGTAQCYLFPFEKRKNLMKQMLTVLSPKKGWKLGSVDKKYDEFIYRVGEGDYSLEIGLSQFSYLSSTVFDKIHRCIDLPQYDQSEDKDRFEPYETKKEFAFRDEDGARQQILDFMQLCGVSIGDEYDCHTFYMDHALMKDMQYEMGMDGKEDTSHYCSDWRVEDDGYYFCMRQTFCGLPLYTDVVGKGTYNASIASSNILGLVRKDGIDYLDCRVMLKTQQGKEATPISMDKVVAAIKDHYEPVAKADQTVEYSINRIELMEAAVKQDDEQYELTPAWICFVKQKTQGMEGAYYEQILINAITGQEITQVYEEW